MIERRTEHQTPNTGMPFLQVRNLSKTYPGGSTGLARADCTVTAGERIVLIGPSGSGKSTLLRLLCGLETPDSGEIVLNGRRIERLPPHQRGIGFIPQKAALYPQWNVKKNLEVSQFPVAEVPGSQVAPPEVIEMLRLSPLLRKFPHELSGGERQRVALARLLLRGAPLWLLDEPFSYLDSPFRAEFRHELHLMLERASATMILVTHDPADAWMLGGKVGVLEGGRLRPVVEPAELRSDPPCSFAAFSLASFQRIDGFVEWNDTVAHGRCGTHSLTFVSECGSVRIPIPSRIAQGFGTEPPPRMTFGLRPEDIIARLPGSPPPSFEESVELRGWPPLSAEPAGSGWLLTVARGKTRLRTEWRSASPPPVGLPIDWVIAVERGLWFNGATGERLRF